MLFTQCTQHNALLTSFPMQFPVFLSPSDGAPNPPHGRSHPPLLYIMIIHYFPPLGFPSRFCPFVPGFGSPTKWKARVNYIPPLLSRSLSSGPLLTLASPFFIFLPFSGKPAARSTARPGAGLAHMRRSSRCLHAHTLFSSPWRKV